MDEQPSRRGRSRWTRTLEGRFAPAPQPSDAEPRPTAVGPGGGSERILLVEDQDQVREAARTILERLGYRVDAMSSADEALGYFRGGGRVDLLVTDVVLPGMNGVALAERAIARDATARVLFISSYTSGEGMPERAFNGRPSAFLQKPFGLGVLTRAVREILDRTE